MLYELNFFPRFVSDPYDCSLVHTSAMAQKLGSDTSAKTHSICDGHVCVGKDESKRTWSKMCLIKDLHVPNMLKQIAFRQLQLLPGICHHTS